MPGNHTRNVAAIVLMVVPLCVLAVGALWLLHTPEWDTRTPVPIDRNSLLPHHYAGPCMNCHRIVEVGPTALSRSNMAAFALTAQQQRLLLAGQSVVVPSTPQQLRVPAITRTDVLPHPYVGVCSNCHVVLDVHPSPEFMKAAMQHAHQRLSVLDLEPAGIARAGAAPSRERARYRVTWGYVALPLLLLTCVYIVLRHRGGRATRPQAWLAVHEWSGAAFALAATIHWYYSDRGNNFLHLAFVCIVWLVAGGLMLHVRMVRRDSGGSSALLHAQRLVFLALVVLATVGHLLASFR